ncbi:cytochrome c oxidase assembly protein [Azotobacter vinelandii]|uniref:cytochrome c oxidase assembly protein n=1 Tax=Azotobacter vinelandii TaxID=354 RepID=UPI00266602C5|nr:cytochrome c oxidase assembly protein [Azotobacter vinelandii]WKN23690.1 cytochrome c oxidase assembly protein [Azotobacter vinelandii]
MEHAAVHAPAHADSVPALLFPALLLGLYAFAALRPRRAGRRWSPWRTLSFALGTALLGLALAPPVVAFAHADLRGHMLQHLLLGMFVPLGLVLGAPGTLLLRTLPIRATRILLAFLDSRPLRTLIHPLTALVLDIGGMYLLYLTPLFVLSAHDPLVHFLVHLHFLLSGYLFTWAIAGPDPTPHRPGPWLRLGVLFLGTALHATLGKLMYAYGFPRGTAHPPSEIRAAAQLMYYGGDVAELLLAIALFTLWFRRAPTRAFPGRIDDRHALPGSD